MWGCNFFFPSKYTAHQTFKAQVHRPGSVTWYSKFLQTLQNFSLEEANIMTLPSSTSFPLLSSVGV